MHKLSSRRNWYFIIIVCVVAVLIRLAGIIFLYGQRNLSVELASGGDAGSYISMASTIYLQGDLSNPLFLPRQPGFPMMMAFLWKLFGVNVGVVILANTLLNVISCVLVMWITDQLSDMLGRPDWPASGAGLIAGLLAAIYPAMVSASVTVMSEACFVFLFLLGFGLFVRFLRRGRVIDLITASVFLGAAMFTRTILLVMPVVLLPVIFFTLRKYQRKLFIILASSMIFLGVSLALPNAILIIRNAYYAGIPTTTTASSWMLLFMRSTSSERRATGDEPLTIYRREIQEIERRLGNPVPASESIDAGRIWKYYVPTAQENTVIGKLAIERNLAYPQWYVVNSFLGVYNMVFASELIVNSPLQLALHGVITLLMIIGCVRLWQGRRWTILYVVVLNAVLMWGVNVALQTALLNTRHGLSSAVIMFPVAAFGAMGILSWALRSRTANPQIMIDPPTAP